MTAPRPNWRRLANGHYLVRTQAGFNQALRDYFNEYQLHHLSDIAGYPKVYPSVVRLVFLHGWNEPQAHCTPINQYKAELAALAADLAAE
ncbi:hypothetical protein HZF02_32275 (plasmid) [Pseudomonas yamanorum]|nr:hypothetical protein HZF02_32275 [Pseudomonas yamanorum]